MKSFDRKHKQNLDRPKNLFKLLRYYIEAVMTMWWKQNVFGRRYRKEEK